MKAKNLITLFLLIFCQCISQVQRMRLPAGEYAISGRTHIPAMCIDQHLDPPYSLYHFEKSTSNITVTQKTPTGSNTLPLDDALKDWVDMTGIDGKIDAIEIRPKNLNDKSIYTLKVENEAGIIGKQNQDLTKNLPEESVFKKYEQKSSTVQDKTAENYLNQVVLWKIASNASTKEIEELLSDYKLFEEKISSISNAELKKEALFHALTSIENINKIVRIDEAVKKLSLAFGKEHSITKMYLSTNRILPYSLEKLGNKQNLTEIFSIYQGQKLNDSQIQTLAELTGFRFDSYAGTFDNSVLIKQNAEWTYDICTTSNISTVSDLKSTNYSSTFAGKKIFFEGYMTSDVANWLRKNGVRMYTNFSKAITEAEVKGPIKPIIVSSKNPAIIAKLFGTSDRITEITNITNEAEKISSAKIVETEKQLTEEIARLSKEEIPLIIFNNGPQGIMFDKPYDPGKLRYGISCHSYQYNYRTGTTDFMDYKCVIKAIAECQLKYGNDYTSMDDYMLMFHEVYEQCVRSKTKKIKTGLLAVGGVIAGGTIYGYYATKDE
jgi:hypothetical protein